MCNSKAFVDIAAAGSYRGLSTIYIERNLFHRSNFSRDVELQNTHFVLFKSSLDVMQVSTLSAHLGEWWELVDWYQDALSVPYGHSLIDLPPRTDGRLGYCTNTGSIPPKFHVPEPLKRLKSWDDEHTKSVYSSSVPIIFPQLQKSFPSVLFKRVYPVSLRMDIKFAQRKPAKHKKSSRGKVSTRGSTIVSETNILEAEKRNSGVRKCLQLIKIITPLVIILLSWHGVVCSRSCFCVQQKCDYRVSYKAGASKVSNITKSHVPNWFTSEGDKQKVFCQSKLSVDKFLSCPRIKLSTSQTLFADGVKN